MGKPTGFLEYKRIASPTLAPLERIKNFLEFHPSLELAKRREQAARCMNCGVPFCQSGTVFGGMVSGCPLHNLIPEWNDAIYSGDWHEALTRLLKTNSFPEFTGRVCPALCEAACTCGMNGESVTVHDNELAVIETGFKNGWMTAKVPEIRSGKRVAIVGSGPAGLAAADRLNERGHSVTVFERAPKPGGLLMYGIPNMKLDKSVVKRRVDLMREEGVEFVCGVNVGVDVSAEKLLEEYDAVVLACGSKTPRDINVPGRDSAGVHFAVDYLTSATECVVGDSNEFRIDAKGKNVVVVGGGDTGNDCVGTAVRQGCKSVVQLEMMKKLPDKRAENNPWPQWARVCKTDYGQEEAAAVFGHDPRIYETTVKEIISDENGQISAVKTVKLEAKKDESGRSVMSEIKGSESVIPCELLLIAAGFVGCESYISDAFGIEKTPRGCLTTDSGKYSTAVPKVFTAGDAHRGQSLVVWAISEGRACAAEVDEFLMEYSNME